MVLGVNRGEILSDRIEKLTQQFQVQAEPSELVSGRSSQKLLLRMVQKGMLREDAYRIVQKNAHAAFDEQVLFDDKVKSEPKIKNLFSATELEELFSFAPYTLHADEIFNRVYGAQK